MSEKTGSWWADEVIRRMEADPNTDLAPVAVGQMITAQAFAEAIAAAEERGRRRGVEERDELRATIAELLPMAERAHHADLGKHLCPDISSLPEGLRIAREGALLLRLHHPDLAPRDSAPVCDAVVSSDPFREWRCGKPKGHEGPHSGEGPRDSGKEPE